MRTRTYVSRPMRRTCQNWPLALPLVGPGSWSGAVQITRLLLTPRGSIHDEALDVSTKWRSQWRGRRGGLNSHHRDFCFGHCPAGEANDQEQSRGGVSNIASAAVGGLDTDTGVDNDGGDPNLSGQRQSSRTSSSSMSSKLFGACGPAEALDLDLVRGAATKLRIPTRTESAEFVKNLSLSERLRDVKDGLNAKLGACVSTSKGDDAAADTTSGSKSPRVDQGNALSSSDAQDIHRSSATGPSTASVDESSHASYHTFETKDTKQQEERLEEMHHLERMTSWNTLGTASQCTQADDASIGDNINAMGMLGLDNKQGRSAAGGNGEGALEGYIASSSPPKQPIVDDDGNEISSEMITSLKARREQREAAASAAGTSQRAKKKTSSSRRRVVQFDYPPISSLRECPRHDPADQGKLFFSEEELDELEEDRIACKMVDDIEVVAVPAMASAASPAISSSSPNGAGERGGKKLTKREARKLALSASQKLRRSSSSSASPNINRAFGFVRSASASMTPNGSRAFGIPDNSTANSDDDGGGGSPTASPANAAGNNSGAPEGRTTDNSGGPLIKGVQIYLRQRSTNEAAKKGRK